MARHAPNAPKPVNRKHPDPRDNLTDVLLSQAHEAHKASAKTKPDSHLAIHLTEQAGARASGNPPHTAKLKRFSAAALSSTILRCASERRTSVDGSGRGGSSTHNSRHHSSDYEASAAALEQQLHEDGRATPSHVEAYTTSQQGASVQWQAANTAEVNANAALQLGAFPTQRRRQAWRRRRPCRWVRRTTRWREGPSGLPRRRHRKPRRHVRQC